MAPGLHAGGFPCTAARSPLGCTSQPLAAHGCATPRRPLERLLAAALALAACGFGPLSALGAGLGLLGRDRLTALPNSRQGVRWANAAIVVGLLNSVLWVGAWTWFLLEPETQEISTSSALLPFSSPAVARSQSFSEYPEIETLPDRAAAPAQPAAAGTTGEVASAPPAEHAFREIGERVESLGLALERHARRAGEKNLKPLVWLVPADCPQCESVQRAVARGHLNAVLSHASVVQVSVERFESELAHMRFPTQAGMGFVLLSPEGLPLDFVDGREWQGRSLSGVLSAFVSGALEPRAHPWRGGVRPDEMSI